jgi:hypothetical protein
MCWDSLLIGIEHRGEIRMTALAEHHTALKCNKFYSAMLYLYFLLSPFYLLSSGLPQMADMVLILTFLVVLFSRIVIFQSYKVMFFIGITFTAYIFIINTFWAYWLSDISIIFSSAYYIYNIMSLFTFFLLFEKLGIRLFRIIYFAVSASVILQFILSLFFNSGQYRESLFYNNPNQLGYASLVSLAILLVTFQAVKRGKWLLLISLTCNLVLIAASLSKAANISGWLMIIIWIIVSKQWSVKVTTMMVTGMLAIFFVTVPDLAEIITGTELVQKLDARMADIGHANDDNPALRGYDRIVNHPEYLIFGSGEGAYSRFDSQLSGYEIHSTFGNLFFSYGFVGLLIFLIIILMSIYRTHLVDCSPLFFVLLYGIAHNGIRSTIFWVLLSLIYLCSTYRCKGKEEGHNANIL